MATSSSLVGCGCTVAPLGTRGRAPIGSAFSSLRSARPASRTAYRERASRCGASANSEKGAGRAGAGSAAVRASGRGRVDDLRVIEDGELRLEDLSLEYESVWDTKPAWCQPWTIVGTGVGVIITSWVVLHNIFLTGGATMFVSLWWFSFLYSYPLAYSEMIAERRRMVDAAREDSYDKKKVD